MAPVSDSHQQPTLPTPPRTSCQLTLSLSVCVYGPAESRSAVARKGAGLTRVSATELSSSGQSQEAHEVIAQKTDKQQEAAAAAQVRCCQTRMRRQLAWGCTSASGILHILSMC